MTEISDLESVSLREQWPDEEADFTPWLARNITYLEDAIEMTLDVQDTEVTIGGYFADIHATDVDGERDIIIENQYGRTDHRHLGQSVVYAGGVDAAIVIWLAEEFDDPHLDALQWLNERTTSETAFIGVELGLVRIEDSPVAPRFTVVEQPSQWKPGDLDATEREHLQFWKRFEDRADARGLAEYTMDTTRPTASYVTRSFTDAYIRPAATARNRVYCMLRIIDESGNFGGLDRAAVEQDLLDAFERLAETPVSEADLQGINWESAPGQKYDKIVVEYTGDIDRSDHSQWQRYHDWILDMTQIFEDVFEPRFGPDQ